MTEFLRGDPGDECDNRLEESAIADKHLQLERVATRYQTLANKYHQRRSLFPMRWVDFEGNVQCQIVNLKLVNGMHSIRRRLMGELIQAGRKDLVVQTMKRVWQPDKPNA